MIDVGLLALGLRPDELIGIESVPLVLTIRSPEGVGMVIAAIHARTSTEQNGVGDETKSVSRQVEHARRYAAQRGWVVPEDQSRVQGLEHPPRACSPCPPGHRLRPMSVMAVGEPACGVLAPLGQEVLDSRAWGLPRPHG